MKAAWISAGVLSLALSGACTQGVAGPGAGPTSPSATDLGNPADAAAKSYSVTIENLTSAQPLSPGVVVTHGSKVHAFEVGSPASDGIRLIAENGDPATAVAALSAHPEVFEAIATSAPIHRVGGPGPSSITVDIDAAAGATQLSVAVMLICTNDGFTGVDSLRLPGGFQPETYLAAAYDAGTEANNEQYTQIVDACGAIGPVSVAPDGQNGRVATSNPITHHPNIQGGADLTIADHGWTEPVARITVQRVK